MKLNDFEPLNYLQSEEDCRQALTAACDEDPGDGRLITSTLKDIVTARGITLLAQEAGVSRETLSRLVLSKDDPDLETLSKVAHGLGIDATPFSR